MDSTESVAQLARTLGRTEFESRFTGIFFLVKRPSIASAAPTEDEVPISYRTTHVRVTHDMIDAHDVFGAELRVWTIEKRPDNPYPDRVGVGRAPNCDVVLRAPYLSKLHAHFSSVGDRWLLSDNRSANGTSLNGKKLAPGESMQVQSGDRINFGGIELEILDAEGVYELLT